MTSAERQKLIKRLAKQLINMSVKAGDDYLNPERAVYVNSKGRPKSSVIQIGRKLHELGGIELMRAVGSLVPKYDKCEINWAWNNIGEWEA